MADENTKSGTKKDLTAIGDLPLTDEIDLTLDSEEPIVETFGSRDLSSFGEPEAEISGESLTTENPDPFADPFALPPAEPGAPTVTDAFKEFEVSDGDSPLEFVPDPVEDLEPAVGSGAGGLSSEVVFDPPSQTELGDLNLDFEPSVNSPHEPSVGIGSDTAEPEFTPPPVLPTHTVKEFSERMIPGAPPVEAAYPYSLLLTGKLKVTDREKLLTLIQRENMGFREVELETQLEEGKILLPRISEYAAILIVQAMRDSGMHMRLGPSDTIFSTPDTIAQADDPVYRMAESEPRFSTYQTEEPFFITSGAWPHETVAFEVIETFTASLTLSTRAVEAETSNEYQEACEGLKRELRMKAQLKGANALVHFNLTLVPLGHSTRYKLMAVATAIKSQGAFPPYMPSPPTGLSG